MTNQHPIMPPDELVQQWRNSKILLKDALIIAAQWGADQELEACCEWLENQPQWMEDLRAARRPKSPSLKERALGILDVAHHDVLEDDQIATIRRALEALPE